MSVLAGWYVRKVCSMGAGKVPGEDLKEGGYPVWLILYKMRLKILLRVVQSDQSMIHLSTADLSDHLDKLWFWGGCVVGLIADFQMVSRRD